MEGKSISARNANTLDKICSIRRDNICSGDCNIHIDETHVNLDNGSERMRMKKKDFNKLIDWYNREQKVKPNKLWQIQ